MQNLEVIARRIEDRKKAALKHAHTHSQYFSIVCSLAEGTFFYGWTRIRFQFNLVLFSSMLRKNVPTEQNPIMRTIVETANILHGNSV